MKLIDKLCAVAVTMTAMTLVACTENNSEQIKALEAERDSLATAAKDAGARYDELTGYLNEISECIDSVSSQEKVALVDNDPETGRKLSRTEIRARISDLGSLIERQRNRITALTDSLGGKVSPAEVERLTQLVTYLNEQLAAKEVQMQKLQQELATSKRSISELRTTVATQKAANEVLTNENTSLDQMVAERSDQLNQGWLLAKPKKDLEALGVLSKGSIFKGGKFNPGAVSTADCVALDTRSFSELSLKSKKKPVLLSQAPASSYRMEEVSKGNWKLVITDTMAFWSLSKIVVIQLS